MRLNETGTKPQGNHKETTIRTEQKLELNYSELFVAPTLLKTLKGFYLASSISKTYIALQQIQR
jgi:hypothetical protein